MHVGNLALCLACMNDQVLVLILCFWCYDIQGLVDPGEAAPPRASQLLEIVNDSLSRVPFICANSSVQNSHLHHPCLGHIFRATLSLLNHPMTKYQTARDNPYAPESTEIFQSTNPKLLFLPHPFLPLEATGKDLACIFHLLLLPPDWLVLPCWPLCSRSMSLSFGNCE